MRNSLSVFHKLFFFVIVLRCRYVMFVKPESVGNAVLLNETTFRGRPIKVIPKRTNVPAAPSPYGGRGRGGPPAFGEQTMAKCPPK